jgi:hypothetical protein
MSNFLDEWHKLWDEEDRKMTEQRIEAARKQGKIYDIDRLFWDGGKLFGYDTYFKTRVEYDGEKKQYGPFTKIKTDNKEYEVLDVYNRYRELIKRYADKFNPFGFEYEDIIANDYVEFTDDLLDNALKDGMANAK